MSSLLLQDLATKIGAALTAGPDLKLDEATLGIPRARPARSGGHRGGGPGDLRCNARGRGRIADSLRVVALARVDPQAGHPVDPR